MPKRTDLHKILLIGSGPIIIGQACEFDYSGTQAVKALKEEGYEVILLNSNPATIMTDQEMADRTYIEPMTLDTLEKIFQREKPDALLPTIGGQTALNLTVDAYEDGLLERYGVELIGAKYEAIRKAEDREEFRKAIIKLGLHIPHSKQVATLEEAQEFVKEIGYPVIIRPSFTLGGTGGNIAYNVKEFDQYVRWGLDLSPKHTVLIEQSVIGWKEYEHEVMRDHADNVVIICSIENLDPMGVHTGDSITVAPIQTLTDKEYQLMRDASLRIIREIGVDTGGCNIQYAINPANGDMIVIEMNPRVSRSSALASKATGFPIAKIAAKLAVGYRLDEIENDITKKTKACFEPTIDYCVVKIPRFDFEKFPNTDKTLTTQMKSVGEVMSIARTMPEALQKAVGALENRRYSLHQKNEHIVDGKIVDRPGLEEKLRVPGWNRIHYICEAMRAGMTEDEIFQLTAIDPWFVAQFKYIVDREREIVQTAQTNAHLPAAERFDADLWRRIKRDGFSDHWLAELLGVDLKSLREIRKAKGVSATFKMVDTCGAEFEAFTPYYYSTYESECEANPPDTKKVMILGGGPNRIGQGIEFDYCCVHGAIASKEAGFTAIMVNCNPETVSTDYDISDRLYFEPVTYEHVMNIVETEKPYGVVLQFGGQTPLKLAQHLERAGVPILGTQPDAIDRTEDRERFKQLLSKLGLKQPPNGTALSAEQAVGIANEIGYPVVVRPSYVLGGRAMEIVHDQESLSRYMNNAVEASPDRPVLIDKFLTDAIEVDVDAICDGTQCVVGGIMEQIEQAGVHSGDSSCSVPPYSLSDGVQQEIVRQTKALAFEIGVVGLINVQFAVQNGDVLIIEVNPRASRTVPFLAKAIGRPLVKIATKVMLGLSLVDQGFTEQVIPRHFSVKEAVFPFIKFPNTDTVLGPEMKSTGEVMGTSFDFGEAFGKAQIAAGNKLPTQGNVFLSVRKEDRRFVPDMVRSLQGLGFNVISTKGTARTADEAGLTVETVNKVQEGRPHIVDKIVNREIDLVINTTSGTQSIEASRSIRRSALEQGVPYFTTIFEAMAGVKAIAAGNPVGWDVRPIQEYYSRDDDSEVAL
ncbi:MAG: carbamoyl-phosphate synthase large subunit [Deltaproteobacteria bacterium]|nr:carbamoyl-phosphate synthase large subunit [Deltaproteobacteria bacterium]